MNEEPLKLLPDNIRNEIINNLNSKASDDDYKLKLDGALNPVNEFYYNQLMERHGGDYRKVLEHIVVRRITLSEKNRVGIGTFQPKDEKSQDATELPVILIIASWQNMEVKVIHVHLILMVNF